MVKQFKIKCRIGNDWVESYFISFEVKAVHPIESKTKLRVMGIDYTHSVRSIFCDEVKVLYD